MRRALVLTLLAPWLLAFDGSEAREALDRAFHNLYGHDLLAGIELRVDDGFHPATSVGFAFGRKTKGGEVRTLVYTGDGKRDSARALVLQRPGERDRIYATSGARGEVRPVAAGRYEWPMFQSDFHYDDFRAKRADAYRIEVLGEDQIDGEPCRVLRLRPFEGPYAVMIVWLSTRRPVIVRTDYFDDEGLWKRYRVRIRQVTQRFDWWIPLEDEMTDLRSGRRTTRLLRNLLIDAEVPDEVFTLTRLQRGSLPSF